MPTPQQQQSLQTLLRMQPQISQGDPLDSLGPTDYELQDVQAAIGEHGADSGGPYFVPSRDSLKSSAMGGLRRLLQMNEIEAQNRALPAQIQGQYRLQEAGINAKGRVDAARAQAERAGQDRAFRAGENALNREAAGTRATQAQQAVSDRTAATRKATGDRATQSQNFQQIKALQGGKSHATRPEANGLYEGLQRFLHMGKFGQEAADQAEISRLQGSQGADPIGAAVAQLDAEYPSMSTDDLVAQGIVNGSPDEIMAVKRARGR